MSDPKLEQSNLFAKTAAQFKKPLLLMQIRHCLRHFIGGTGEPTFARRTQLAHFQNSERPLGLIMSVITESIDQAEYYAAILTKTKTTISILLPYLGFAGELLAVVSDFTVFLTDSLLLLSPLPPPSPLSSSEQVM